MIKFFAVIFCELLLLLCSIAFTDGGFVLIDCVGAI